MMSPSNIPPPHAFTQHHIRLGLPVAMTITICGGGRGAHTAAAYLGSKPGLAVNILTRRPIRWNKQILLSTDQSSWEMKGDIWGLLNIVTDEPSQVIPQSNIIIIVSPAYAHRDILNKIAPFLNHGAVLGSIFCQGGFDWAVKSSLGSSVISKLDGIWGLFNIPWVCTTLEYGVHAKIIGTKKHLRLCSCPPEKASEFARMAEFLFDIPCKTAPNFLSLVLTPSNQIIHPARYYAIFKNWDGKSGFPIEQVSFGLYYEFDDESAYWLQKLDDELQAIKKGLVARFPTLDLSCVLPIGERVVDQYGEDVKDRSSLKTIFRSNMSFAGVVTPTALAADGSGYIPNMDSRLFWEDIPFGICVLKSIARMLGQQTPSIDVMIYWHQKFMGKQFLLSDGTFNKDLIHETGIPEAYRIFNLDDLVAPSLPQSKSIGRLTA